jgi:signal transduction histidine kinase
MKTRCTVERFLTMSKNTIWYDRTSAIVGFSSLLGSLGWFLHAAFESFFLPNKTFQQLFITDVSLHDITIRLILSACFFIAGALLMKMLIRRRYAEENLKESYETLRRTNELLEQKISDKTTELEMLVKQKNNLIVSLSHDLKTPLTPLMGVLPLIIREEKDMKLKELLQMSLRNVHYLRDLVSRTIDLSLLDSTTIGMTLENIHVYTKLESVLENRSYTLTSHHMYIDNKIDEHLMVYADKLKLREVFHNLLMNSIKYSHSSGGTITLQAIPDDNHVKIWITDTGIGMTEEQLHDAFHELYKADPARNDHASTGLGLAICKRIVEKHGGKIWLESQGQGKGTTVFFTLPAPTA